MQDSILFVGDPGLEPGTSPSQTARASQLRQSPKIYSCSSIPIYLEIAIELCYTGSLFKLILIERICIIKSTEDTVIKQRSQWGM